MPNEQKTEDARAAYKAALGALVSVMSEYEDGPALDEANESFRAVRRAYNKALNDDFANRAKLLRRLIDELEDVIAEVALNPIGEAFGQLNGALSVAKETLAAEG